MKKLALLALLPSLCMGQVVKWEDTLGYTKPAPISAGMPVDDPTTPRYYVDMNFVADPTTPTNNSCTQSTPCTSLATVVGKTGTAGGPAIIYVKGTGVFGNPAIYGGVSTPVIIRAYADTTFTGSSTVTAQMQYVYIDGGPKSQITFSLTSAITTEASLTFAHTGTTFTNVTFKNVRWKVINAGNWLNLAGRYATISFLNNEFSASGAASSNHSLQVTGGTGIASALVIKSSVFRDSFGPAIDVALTQTLTDLSITRSVFHDLGSAVKFGINGGAYAGTIAFNNNWVWDTVNGCALTWSNPVGTQVYNNTCYNWGTTGTAAADVIAFSDQALTSNPPGDFRNNLLYATGTGAGGQTKYPFPANASVDSFNGCRSGVSCGTSSQVISAATFQSLTETAAAFLRPAVATTAIDTGTTLASATPDYSGFTRPLGGSYDLGAYEYGTGSAGTAPQAPTGGGGIACAVGAYGAWVTERLSNCTAGTQELYQTRYRLVTTFPANGGTACPALSEENIPRPTQSCSGTAGLPPVLVAAPGQTAPFNHNSSTHDFSVAVSLAGRSPAADGIGAYRPQCDYSHMAFVDPLVYPGLLGKSHLHTFAGNTLTDQNTTPLSLTTTGNSTCKQIGIDNRSGYWVPSVIDTRTGTPIAPDDFMIYYKKGYNSGIAANIIDIPVGLVMITGRTQADTPATSVPFYASRYNFSCYIVALGHGDADYQYIPPCEAGVGNHVWVILEFPNCWDGVNLDSPNHRTHVANSGGGVCPSSHPYQLPQVSYVIHWPVRAGDDTTYWRLSSDMYYGADPTAHGGYTMHGDLMFGWVPSVMTTFMDLCVRIGVDCH